MELRFKSKYDYDYTDYIVDPFVKYSETVADMNISIQRLLQDFVRDPYEFVNDDDDDVYLPGENMPSIDPLTDMDEMRSQYEDITTKLNNLETKED